MSGGGGSQTSTTSNAPPQQYLNAYSQVMGQAAQAAATPYQAYPGQLQAGWSPQQEQAFTLAGNSVGEQAPYFNQASQDYTNSTAPLQPLMQPYLDQAQQNYQNASNTNLQGALSPYQTQAAQGFGQVANTNLQGSIGQAQQAAYQGYNQGSQTLTPQQYSGQAVNQYYNPYQQSVVDATQQQFNLSNATQQNQLQGNAASQGALGGDRVGVAQAALAGQQQAQQAPVIAGLESSGFNQAQNEFNTQQQTNLTAQQQSDQLKQSAAQGYTSLGNQSLSAAQGQAALQSQAAQGFAGLGGQSLTAAQQQAALYNQSGQGQAALGQAELSAGQSQGWLNAQAGSGLAGLGNAAQAGTLASANALLGTGALQQQQAQQSLNIPYEQYQAALAYPFQTTGWLSNIAQGLGSASGNTATSTTPGPSTGSQLAGVGALGAAGAAYYGSQNGWFGGSGGTTGASIPYSTGAYTAGVGGDTFAENRGGAVPRGFAGGGGVPDVSINGIGMGNTPGSQSVLSGGFGVPDVSASVIPSGGGGGGTPLLKRNYGTTQTTSGGGGFGSSTLGQIVNTGAVIAADVYGSPAAGAAVGAGLQATGLQRGGHVPVLSRGFAAGGSPGINITTVPNARGIGVPTMNVNQGGGDTASSLNDYLTQTAAGAYHPPAPTPPAASQAPAPNQLTSDQTAQMQAMLQQQHDQYVAMQNVGDNATNVPQARGGMVRGFDGGGDVSGSDDSPYNADTGVASMIVPFLKKAWQNQQDQNDAFKAQTGAYDDMMKGRGVDPLVQNPDAGAPPPDLPPDPADQRGFGRGVGDHSATGFGANADAGSDADLPTPPIPPDQQATPAGPADTTTSGGFGTHGPAGPPVPDATTLTSSDATPAPPSAATPSTGFAGSKADALSNTRAAKEDSANPWLSLALAGAGMMAGTSPHAMTNIGQGLGLGLTNYIKTDQAAKELAAKVEENKVRLAETQAYHGITAGINQQKANTSGDRANAYIANQMASAALKDQQTKLGPKTTSASIMQATIDSLTDQVNPATGAKFTPAEAYSQVKGLDIKAAGQQAIAKHYDNQDAAAQARQASIDENNKAMLQFKANHDVNGMANGIMRNAALNGKTISAADAMTQAQTAMGDGGTAPAAPKLLPPPAVGFHDPRLGTFKGGNPADRANWTPDPAAT